MSTDTLPAHDDPESVSARPDMRKQIALLADDFLALYQNTRKERHQLHKSSFNKKSYCLDEIEAFSDDVQGYADQVAQKGKISDPAHAIERLISLNSRKLMLLVAQYPHLRRYVALHDYLRRLLIDYVRAQ
jgi:hypothetical protein